MKATFILSLICTSAVAQLSFNHTSQDLDKNYVKAKIMTCNDKHWNMYGNGKPAYEVPAGKGTHAMYANSLWIGGLDAGGQLHVAANTYKQNGSDFWPGPLDTTNIGAFSAVNSTPYNKLWKVDCNDITNFVTAFNSGFVAAGTYTVPDGILTYPAKGTANFQRNMLPYMDVNHDGLYNPQTDGDYPLIKGNQQILSIYNDNNGIHSETQGNKMGLEIYERSYVYFEPSLIDTAQSINYTTYYHYIIYNRSNTSYNNVYITDWSDVDLGYYGNDYIGTDSVNNFAYCYNGTATDPNQGSILGYGNKPPVLSHAILKTNCSSDGIDNNNNGQIDESGEQFLLNKTTYYNNNIVANAPPGTTNPSIAVNYYNYMKGIWENGLPFTYGGTAYGGTAPTNFVYTGNPEYQTGWTEGNANNAPGDRRIVLSSGPFNFPAGSKIEWGYALVFSQDTTQAVNTISQYNKRVIRDVRNAQIYDETHQAAQCAPQINVGIEENKMNSLKVMVYPNPAKDLLSVDLMENVNTADITLLDLFGRALQQAHITNGYRGTLDLSSLESGIYFVEISSGNKKSVEKIIKN